MFTGIVEELGTVRAAPTGDPARLVVAADRTLADATIGASIAVNGACLTVVDLGDHAFTADVAPETLARTTLGALAAGDPVNLERPVRLSDRLGGHLVQGHVDGVGTVTARSPDGDGSTRLTVRLPEELLAHVVEKGSVTLDGVSLTVTAVDDETLSVALIPHTLTVTTLGSRAPGAAVNVETDVVAKYVQRLLEPHSSATGRR